HTGGEGISRVREDPLHRAVQQPVSRLLDGGCIDRVHEIAAAVVPLDARVDAAGALAQADLLLGGQRARPARDERELRVQVDANDVRIDLGVLRIGETEIGLEKPALAGGSLRLEFQSLYAALAT